MKISRILFNFLYLLVFISSSPIAIAASQSDLAKERRWEEQIVPAIFIGEDMKLEADGVEFLALYAEPTTEDAKGAVILLHGIGVHPAWPDVIEPLRMQLPDAGWHTLSLQMPVLGNEAESTDYPALFAEVPGRIQAGVDFLKDRGIRPIVLAGHSMGATMAAYYLASARDPAVAGFVILSGGPGVPGDPRMDSLANFRVIQDVDILDVHGSEDEKAVLQATARRNELAPDLHGNRYRQLEIDGAGHFYRDQADELVREVSAALETDRAP